MKKILAIFVSVLALAFTACDPTADAIVQVFLGDLAAAQSNFTLAGMTNEAQCMKDAQDKVNGLLAAVAQGNQSYQNKGVISLGSIAYIKAAGLRAQLAGQLTNGGVNSVSPACTEVVGAVTMAAGSMGLVVPNLPPLQNPTPNPVPTPAVPATPAK